MGYLGYFYVENKAFEFRSNVQGGVQMAEKSRGKCRTVIMAWPTIFWLVSAWDYLINIETSRENWRTFRFGCLAYVMQRRTNSHGNFLELSEYGGKGRRSFVIIPEGIEGKGWEDCRVQLQRLKIHHEKNRQKIGADRELVGKKEQSSGVQQTKPPVKITYAAAVVGEKAMAGETKTAGDGVQKAKTSLGIMHAEAMVGGKEMAGKTQVAGEGPSKLVSEGAKISAICSGDHAQADCAILRPQNQGEDIQGMKEILISLQREVTSCLYKLEMGWGNKGKGENGLTFGPHKEVGSGCIRSSPGDKPIFRYFRKTYARRQPRRLLRWRPKRMGRLEDQATGESSETSRNRPPEQIISGTETEMAAKKNAQPSAEDITRSNGAIGGGEAVTTDEHAGTNAELAGNCGASSESADRTIYQLSTGVVPAAVTPVGEESANTVVNDTELAESEEKTTGADIRNTGRLGEVTDKAKETVETDEKGGSEADSAEERKIRLIRDVEGVGQVVDQIMLPLYYAGDVAGGISGSERLVGGIEHVGEMVVYVENSDRQPDTGTGRDADINFGEIMRVDTVEEQGKTEMLEIKPLAIMGAKDCQTETWDGVLGRILAFCQELGSEIDGHEEELMALFTAIEASRNNKKGGNANKKGDKVGNRSNREIKGLKSTVNYDVKGSAIVRGKGRNGKFC
jgi:hypothetical protein